MLLFYSDELPNIYPQISGNQKIEYHLPEKLSKGYVAVGHTTKTGQEATQKAEKSE